MPAFLLPALMTGLSAIGGGLLNKPQTQTQSGVSDSTSNSTTHGTSNIDQSTTPTYDPLQLKMRDFLMSQFFNRQNPNSINNLVQQSIGQGTNAINEGAQGSEQALSAALASRGLSYSPVAGQAIGQQQSNRIGQITQLQGQAPMMQDQLQQQRLTDFSSFLKGLPTGTHTMGTTTQDSNTMGTQHGTSSGTGTTQGNVMGGAFAAGASTLANLYGQGAFNNKPKIPTNSVSGLPKMPK